MAILQIVQGAEAPVLREKCESIRQVDKKLQKLISNMKETMLDAKGVGIAAPQIGESRRVIICRFEANEPGEKIVAMVNPEITWFSEETSVEEEGCLSLPGVFRKIERPDAIQVTFQDEKGNQQTLKYQGFDARIVQHEVDHINGVLFIDYPQA